MLNWWTVTLNDLKSELFYHLNKENVSIKIMHEEYKKVKTCLFLDLDEYCGGT